jgi:ABC-type transport system involved in cytochrome c biogenesis permease subunit
MDPILATIALILIGLAAVLQVIFLLRLDDRRDPVSHFLLAGAAVLLFTVLVDRSLKIHFIAITNTYESLLFFSAAICAVLFTLRMVLRGKLPAFVVFGATIIALALLMISSSPIVPSWTQPPVPALQSIWLALHVSFSFIGEAFFAVSFVAAIAYLAARNDVKRKDLDRIVSTTIGIGYPVFTAGALIFGAIWAETAWGSYWSWDNKEIWALITWLIYTAYLHTRLVRRLRGRLSAILAIAGFAATIFTFFGVNFLLPGLHSYG